VLLIGKTGRTTKQKNEEYDAMTGGVGHVTLWHVHGECLLPSKTITSYDLNGLNADPLGGKWMTNQRPMTAEIQGIGDDESGTSSTTKRKRQVMFEMTGKNSDTNTEEEEAEEGEETESNKDKDIMLSRELLTSVLCCCIVSGKELCTGNKDGELIMWHPVYGDPVGRRQHAHVGEVWCLDSCENVIVSGGEDGYVRVWDLELNCIGARSFPILDMSTGKAVSVHWGIQSLNVIELRSSSMRVALTTEDCRMFTFALPGAGHSATSRLIQEAHHSRELCAMQPHPCDSDLFVTGGDDMTLRVWRISTLSVITRRQLPSMTRAVCWSPDGSLIAVGMGGK